MKCMPFLKWKLREDDGTQELFISISILCLLTKFGGFSSIVVGYLTTQDMV